MILQLPHLQKKLRQQTAADGENLINAQQKAELAAVASV